MTEKAIVDTDDVPLTGPKARRLGDMAGIHLDLRWTAGACAQLIRRVQSQRPDLTGNNALHDAAIIRYGRCFKKGRRNAFQIPEEWVKVLPANLERTHHLVMDLRDKHVAHAVNDWEVNVPVAQVSTIRGTGISTVRAVGVRQMRVVMLGTDALQSLHELAKTLADRIHEAVIELQREIHHDIRGVSPRVLRQRAPRVFPTPGRRHPGSDRSRK